MRIDVKIRRMRYRLNRQGMLELDAWLSPLLDADMENPLIISALEAMMACEAPELQAMMHGELPVPETLKRWLSCN